VPDPRERAVPIFGPKSNLIAKALFLGFFMGFTGLSLASWSLNRSPYLNLTGDYIQQPVPFSHAHHVGGLGLDCRYCHTSVEISSNAGFPSTHTCMTCHSQIWNHAPILAPIRQSYEKNRPIRWKRVYRLPDYVYFDHGIHIAKGVGCATCHGRMDRMPLSTPVQPFYMQQCLACHNHPENSLRPQEEIFNMEWSPPSNPNERKRLGQELLMKYKIAPARRLTDCYVCHR